MFYFQEERFVLGVVGDLGVIATMTINQGWYHRCLSNTPCSHIVLRALQIWMHLIFKKVLGSQGTEHKWLAEFDHYPAAEPEPSRTWGLPRELTSLPSVTLRSTGTIEIFLVEDTEDLLSPSSILESDIRLSLLFFFWQWPFAFLIS